MHGILLAGRIRRHEPARRARGESGPGRGRGRRARAATVTQRVILDAFWHAPQPLFDPLGFLHLTLGKAHDEVVKLGAQLPLEQRPRATCAVCLIQQHASWWAHVGDSRLYHVRHGALMARSRDHSHVELLLREGLISAEQAQTHPMRNFVECCLGGAPILPDMSLTRRRPLEPDDVLLACTDGLWGPLADTEIATGLGTPGELRAKVQELGARAVQRAASASDNTSAAALRWLGD